MTPVDCLSCGRTLDDENQAFCRDCAPDLYEDSAATGEIDSGVAPTVDLRPTAPAGSPSALADRPSVTTTPDAGETRPIVVSVADGDREGRERVAVGVLAPRSRGPVATGWLDAVAVAGFAWLACLAAGAVIVVAAAMLEADLVSAGDTASALTVVAVTSLALLRVPVDVGGAEAAMFPVGALTLVGAAAMWAAARRFDTAEDPPETAGARARRGVVVAVPFALLCGLTSIVFRFEGGGGGDGGAVPGIAVLVGAFWGALFGAAGAAVGRDGVGAASATAVELVRARGPHWYPGLATGATATATGFAAAGAAVAAVAAGVLAVGPWDAGAADAVGGFVLVVAFAPNLAAGAVALGSGGPLRAGAALTTASGEAGDVRVVSLLDWGGGLAPLYLWALVLIPVVAPALACFRARRAGPASPITPVVAAVVFAGVVGILAWVGEAKLAVDGGAGVARIAADAGVAMPLALVWGLVTGTAGWAAAARSPRRVELSEPAAGSL